MPDQLIDLDVLRTKIYDSCPPLVPIIFFELPFVSDVNDMIRTMIRTYTDPGEKILDLRMGTGDIGVIAAEEGRQFVGIEPNRDFYETARNRIVEAYWKRQVEPID